jgi:polyisoprenoid-binding protein YceI
MKRILLTLALCGIALPALSDTYNIDSSHTFTYFEVNHLGLSTFRGRFDKTTGTVQLDRAKKQGSVEITIDANSVSTGVEKLNAHLKNADFFEVEKFPTITFKSSDFRFEEDELVQVIGELTMHGVTRPVTLDVRSFVCKDHPMTRKPACGVDAQTRIKRSDFGINYALPTVADEVTIHIEVEAHKQG